METYEIWAWCVFAFLTVVSAGLLGARVLLQLRAGPAKANTWLLEVFIGLLLPFWLQYYGIANGQGVSPVSDANANNATVSVEYQYYMMAHYVLWMWIAPLQSVAAFWVMYSDKEAPRANVLYYVFVALAWTGAAVFAATASLAHLINSNASNYGWGLAVIGIFIMVFNIVQLLLDFRSGAEGPATEYGRKAAVLLVIIFVSWSLFWVDYLLTVVTGWVHSSWELVIEAVIDSIAVLGFGVALVIFPPSPVLANSHSGFNTIGDGV